MKGRVTRGLNKTLFTDTVTLLGIVLLERVPEQVQRWSPTKENCQWSLEWGVVTVTPKRVAETKYRTVATLNDAPEAIGGIIVPLNQAITLVISCLFKLILYAPVIPAKLIGMGRSGAIGRRGAETTVMTLIKL